MPSTNLICKCSLDIYCLTLTSDGRLRSNLDNVCFKTGSFYDHENA